MNRNISALAICLLMASSAFAGQQKPAPKAKVTAAPTTIACAVEADHKVDIKKATADKKFADYKGNRYFFCCASCPDAFKASPEKFAKAPHIKTPVVALKAKK